MISCCVQYGPPSDIFCIMTVAPYQCFLLWFNSIYFFFFHPSYESIRWILSWLRENKIAFATITLLTCFFFFFPPYKGRWIYRLKKYDLPSAFCDSTAVLLVKRNAFRGVKKRILSDLQSSRKIEHDAVSRFTRKKG